MSKIHVYKIDFLTIVIRYIYRKFVDKLILLK